MHNSQFKYKTLNILGKRKQGDGGPSHGLDLEIILPLIRPSKLQQDIIQNCYHSSQENAHNGYQINTSATANGTITMENSNESDVNGDSGAENFISVDNDNIITSNQRNDQSDVNTESDRETDGVKIPWINYCLGFNSKSASLHNEIVQFCKCLEPTLQERRAREKGVDQVRRVINTIWKDAKVMVFGSFATGLYVPTSDIDLVVVHDNFDDECKFSDELDGMRALANKLTREGIAENAKVISKAKVPLVKFEHVQSGVQFDISFGKANGPQAAEYIKSMLGKWPVMRHLIMLLKVFLQQREMNEVFTGGIGSYALVTMVVVALQTHQSRRMSNSSQIDMNLGILLMDFFRLYGRTLNFEKVGVSANNGGHFYVKRELGFYQEDRRFVYSVQDPNDAGNDLAKGSFASSKIRNAFDHAYMMLTSTKFQQGESMLAKLLNLQLVLAGRGKTTKDLMNRRQVQKI